MSRARTAAQRRAISAARRGVRHGDGFDEILADAAAREFGDDLARAAIDDACETSRPESPRRAMDGGSFPRPRLRVDGDPIAPVDRVGLAPPSDVIAATAARIGAEIAALGRAHGVDGRRAALADETAARTERAGRAYTAGRVSGKIRPLRMVGHARHGERAARARTLPDVVAAIRKLGFEPPPDFSAFPS